MEPGTGITLTATDKVLIHLKDHWHSRSDREFPPAVTQKGISEATGIRLTHVPRTMKSLAERELVGEKKGHVKGEKRRYKVYFLTDIGLAEANTVLGHLKDRTLEVSGSVKSVKDLLAAEKGAILPALRRLAGEECVPAHTPCKIVGPLPPTEGFVDRDKELAELGQMLESDESRVMVIYGSEGYGTSTLAARFLEDASGEWSVAWIPMKKGYPDFKRMVAKTLGQIFGEEPTFDEPEELAALLESKRIIMALDNYFEATDELVEFLAGFVAGIKDIRDFRMLVTARENTPSYNRFYTIMDLHDGTVGEVHIRGLDMEHCKAVLGTPDIDPEALKRLHMFTMGKPETLKLLARGVEKELREKTKFKPEEIKLMLYLKEQRI